MLSSTPGGALGGRRQPDRLLFEKRLERVAEIDRFGVLVVLDSAPITAPVDAGGRYRAHVGAKDALLLGRTR